MERHRYQADEPIPLISLPASYLCSLNLPKLRLPELIRSPYSTSERSVTTPAPRVSDVVGHQIFGLKELYFCDEMADRAFCYIDYPSFTASKLQPRPKHCSECPGASELPPEDYATTHMQLGNFEFAQLGRTDMVALKDNESVREAVNELIFKAVNLALKLRYNNTAALQPTIGEGPESRYRDAEDQPLPYGAIQHQVFSPLWTRPTGHNHIVQATRKAGYSDRILLRSMLKLDPQAIEQTQVAINESKPFWSYTTPHLQALLNGSKYVLNNDSTFNWAKATSHAGNALIQQVYGESLYLGPRIGFFTNGDILILFYRIGPNPSPAQLKAILQGSSPSSKKADLEWKEEQKVHRRESSESETDTDEEDDSGTFRHRSIRSGDTQRSLRSALRNVTFNVDTEDVNNVNNRTASSSEGRRGNASPSPILKSEPGKKGGLMNVCCDA